jgi:hypothetical protein
MTRFPRLTGRDVVAALTRAGFELIRVKGSPRKPGMKPTKKPVCATFDEGEDGEADSECQATARPARRFKDLLWSTLESWSRRRRVIG